MIVLCYKSFPPEFSSWIRKYVFHKLTVPSARTRDNIVGIAIGNGLDDRGFGVRVSKVLRIFSSLPRPDWFCGPPSLLSNGYCGLFPDGKAARARS
jgi:hypothetical protein